MRDHPDIDALTMIADRDPDGGEHQPSAADYANHKAWAIATFGRRVWDVYRHEPWGMFGRDIV